MFGYADLDLSVQQEDVAARQLTAFLIEQLKDRDGRVHAEDMISGAAAIVGERCIDAAGEFSSRSHTFTPGSRVFSDKINDLLCGESLALETLSPSSVFGVLRDRLLGSGYDAEDFPSVEDVFRNFAARIGDPSDWGRVPLTVPAANYPFMMPLRVAHETRAAVDAMFAAFHDDRERCLRVSTIALAQALIAVREAIERRVALLLAFETVNGMAKTAPMTDDALHAAAEQHTTLPPPAKKPWWRFW